MRCVRMHKKIERFVAERIREIKRNNFVGTYSVQLYIDEAYVYYDDYFHWKRSRVLHKFSVLFGAPLLRHELCSAAHGLFDKGGCTATMTHRQAMLLTLRACMGKYLVDMLVHWVLIWSSNNTSTYSYINNFLFFSFCCFLLIISFYYLFYCIFCEAQNKNGKKSTNESVHRNK